MKLSFRYLGKTLKFTQINFDPKTELVLWSCTKANLNVHTKARFTKKGILRSAKRVFAKRFDVPIESIHRIG